MESDDFIPADVVLLSSSEPEGFGYIETSNLDGYVIPLLAALRTATYKLNSEPKRNELEDQAGFPPDLAYDIATSCHSATRYSPFRAP